MLLKRHIEKYIGIIPDERQRKKRKKKTSVALGVFNPHLKYKQIIRINP